MISISPTDTGGLRDRVSGVGGVKPAHVNLSLTKISVLLTVKLCRFLTGIQDLELSTCPILLPLRLAYALHALLQPHQAGMRP